MISDWDRSTPHYKSGQDNEYFGWHDAKHDNVQQLAQKFAERFPEIVAAAKGDDWNYAGWCVRMLGYAENGNFPVAFADWAGKESDPRFLPLLGTESDLLMPPPGDSESGAEQ